MVICLRRRLEYVADQHSGEAAGRYPVDGSLFSNGPAITGGLMYEIGPQPYPLSPASDQVNEQQEVYVANWFLSYPGNSGGPLCVQLNGTGTYYPAGVYLGSLYDGITPYASAVRAIDSNVVNLITNAQAAVTGGTNFAANAGDTVGYLNSQSFTYNPAAVQVFLEPPAAVRAGAGWRVQGSPGYSASADYAPVYTTNPVVVEFAPVKGYKPPTNQTFTFYSAGQMLQFTADYTPTNLSPTQIEVVINGNGTVSPDYSGRTLVPGNSYSMTAKPDTGSVFAGWTGTVVTNAATLKFDFQTNMVEQADFVASPFPPYVGTYNGLFWSSNGVTESNAGMLKGLTVTAKGSYSGSLLLNGASKSLSGSFDSTLKASNALAFGSSEGTVAVMMALISNGVAPEITGTVSNENWVATNLLAGRATNDDFVSSAYTLLISADTNATTSPLADGYALISGSQGTARNPATAKISGALADGTTFSQSTPVALDGSVPVFASLYNKKGLVLGWLNLTNASGDTLSWVHPALNSGLFTTAFTSTNPVQISPWTNPPASNILAQLTNLTILDPVNASSIESNGYTITISNNLRLGERSGSNSLSGSIATKTGLLTLTIGNGAAKETGHAVILLNATNGGGYIVTKTNSQAIQLAP